MADKALGWSGVSDKRSYYRLFAGYVIALVATGIATVALALLAFDLAGEDSGAVIGTALSLKMLAYVLAAPILAALTERIPRKRLLIALDLIRAASLFLLPFVTQVWQVNLLVFVFAVASATFGYVYLAVVPYLLGSEEDYTRSLARSRIASELEGPISPLLAAGLLFFLAAAGIFALSAIAFIVSAALVNGARMPEHVSVRNERFWSKLLRGPKMFLAMPELRSVIAIDVAVALATAMVMVNTVVIVQGLFDLRRDATAWAFFAFGGGSILGAVLFPLVLTAIKDRRIMLIGSSILAAGLAFGALQQSLAGLLLLWALLGFGVAWSLTPITFLIRRFADPADLQILFVAQMSLANLCLLVAYPLAGWLGAALGMPVTFLLLGFGAAIATWVATLLWPAVDSAEA
ncbi:MAG: MFS transporter [Cereibacter sphaeroides]|uniref:MFS transporter n=1 Tax=Cereibacter sphaeroides TaxID=1063 RepID=A0A2W5SEV4_CERSP|nr:MAG: MFS transporter [Cereibacter sphaeroides]